MLFAKRIFFKYFRCDKGGKDFTIIGCQYLFDKIFMPAGFFERKKILYSKKNLKKVKLSL